MNKLGIQKELSAIYAAKKQLELKELSLRKQLADPEKIKKLNNISKSLYLRVLEAEVNDDLNYKQLILNVIESIKPEDLDFFHAHKNDSLNKGSYLFKLNIKHPTQRALVKGKYIGLNVIKKQTTLQQILKCLSNAKVLQYKDILLAELTALRTRESLRFSLFQQEGFSQITDFNERECLIALKSSPKTSDKVLIEKLKIPRSSWYRYKKKFEELKLL
jgi:hypothetical protein